MAQGNGLSNAEIAQRGEHLRRELLQAPTDRGQLPRSHAPSQRAEAAQTRANEALLARIAGTIMSSVYTGVNPATPKGRRNVQAIANYRAQEIADQDFLAHEIIRKETTLIELARREFMKWWTGKILEYAALHHEDPTHFNVGLMEEFFVREFCKVYLQWFHRGEEEKPNSESDK
jgi:hypothetical protein